jgi:hypothetical protein
MSQRSGVETHKYPNWRAVILDNTITPVVAGIFAFIGAPEYALQAALLAFGAALVDFPLYMVSSRIFAPITARVVHGRKATWLEQSYAYSRRHVPIFADIAIGVVLALGPGFIGLTAGDILGLNSGITLLLVVVIYLVLPIPALRESYGLRFIPSAVVEVLALVLFFFGLALAVGILELIIAGFTGHLPPYQNILSLF